MSWLETLRTGLGAVLSHRLRSGLTMLGILIGIAAVILTVGFGEGAQAGELGDQRPRLEPARRLPRLVHRHHRHPRRVRQRLHADRGRCDRAGVEDGRPGHRRRRPATSRSETLTATGTNWTTTVVGTTPDWLSVRARSVTEGRFLTQADENTDAAVAVLGATTAEELFGLRDPVGQTVTVNGLPLTVIGVLNTVGASASSSTTNLDDQAVVPITTVANRIFGGSTRTSVQSIYIEATSSNALSRPTRKPPPSCCGCTRSARPTPTSRSRASSRCCRRPPRSTRPSPNCSRASPRSRCWSAGSAS